MSLVVNCPCGKVLRVKAELSGRRIKCPACQQILAVPSVVEEPAEPVPLLPRQRSAAAGRSGPVWPFVAIPAGVLAAVGIAVLLVVNSGKRDRAAQPPVEQAALAPVPVEAIEPAVEAKPAAKPAPPPTPAIVCLKPADPEASDLLRREDIPPYELFASGRGDPSRAPRQLVAILGDSRLKHWAGVVPMSFSTDGKTLATGGQDETAMIWNLATGKMIRSIHVPSAFLGVSVALSPDGQTVATAASNFGTLTLWDTATGREGVTLKTSRLGVLDRFGTIAFSPDGKLVAAGGSRQSFRFAKRGRFDVMFARFESIVALWNARTGRLLREMPPENQRIVADCFFSQDGKVLIAHSQGLGVNEIDRFGGTGSAPVIDETVQGWDAKTGEETLNKKIIGTTYLTGVDLIYAFSPQKSMALVSREAFSLVYPAQKNQGRSDPPVRVKEKEQWVIVDLATGLERARLDADPDFKSFPHRCAISPNGTTLCLWTEHPEGLRFWDIATGAQRRPKEKLHARGVTGIRYSPDGNKLVLFDAYNGPAVRIWDVAGEKELLPLGRFRGGTDSVSFSPDGAVLAIGVEDGVMIWDIATRTEARFLDGYGRPIAFSPDGRMLALEKDGKVRLCEVATGRERMVFENSPPPAGKDQAGNNPSTQGGFRMLDPAWGAKKNEDGNNPSAVAFSPDGQAIALGYHTGALEVRDTATGKVRQSYRGIAKWATSVAFSPDGRWLAAAGFESKFRPLSETAPEDVKALIRSDVTTNDTVKVWDVATGQIARILPGVPGPVSFSPGGTTLATGAFRDGSSDKLPLWDASTGKLRLLIQPHKSSDTSWASGAVFSPDGTTIAIWSGDGTVRLWDATTGAAREEITLCYPRGRIQQVAFSPTGRYLATANGNGTVYILRVDGK